MIKFLLGFTILFLLCAKTNVDCKKGGTSKGRGVINTIKNTITGNRGVKTGSGSGWKPSSGSGFGRQKPQWTSSGRSSWKSSRNKALLAGAVGTMAGAYVGYKVGKTMGKYSHMYNGRTYWYGSRYYQPTRRGIKTCVFDVDESTPNWNVRYEDDNRLVNDLVFECYSYEYCCEMSCCRTPTYVRNNGSRWRWWHTMLILLFMGILFAACAFSVMKMFNRRRNQPMTVVTTYDDESSKPFNPSGSTQPYPTQPEAYPTAATYYPPYPQQPQSYGYPQQTYAPPSYQ